MRFVAFLSFLLICASAGLFSCTKIEYTTLGVDLASEVNNVTTFDTTLEVTTESRLQFDDTMKLYYYDQLAVGQIKSDPLFGNTNAAIFFELKPPAFSASATAVNFRDSSLRAGSSVGYDSTVLSLKFDGSYGDTSQEVEFRVYLLTDTITRLTDRIYPLVFNADSLLAPGQQPITTKRITLRSLTYDSVLISRSTTLSYKKVKELRIPLPNDTFWKRILSDSTILSDEATFRKEFKGFAVKAFPVGTPGSLSYFSISDTATRLQFYYRRKNAGIIDTTSTSFYFNQNNSGYANNVVWDKNATTAEVRNHLNRLDSLIYVKTNPGTQVRIGIPGLENVSNRIIHRAELKTYVIPNDTRIDGYLIPPPALYLERYDTATTGYLPIPIDLNPNELYGSCFPSTNGINYSYFGGYPRSEVNNSFSGQFYAFNISRYVQQIVTHQLRNTPLRLTANLNAQYAGCFGGLPFRATSNVIGYGRAKLGGGRTVTTGTASPYRMRLRIVYSKI